MTETTVDAINQRFLQVQLVELVHLAFLDVLQVRLNQDGYVLKGGANLRYFYGSPRYSADIDFDVVHVTKEKLEQRVDEILRSRPFAFILGTKALEVTEVAKPKQTRVTQRWKVVLSLPGAPEAVRTKVEFSRRGVVDTRHELAQVPREVTAPYALRPPSVRHYLPQAAIEQKIRTLAARAETQVRDVFDLDLLLRRHLDLPARGSIDPSVLEKAAELTLELPFEAYRVQVVTFLDPGVTELYDTPGAWNQIQEHVVTRLLSVR